MNRTRRCRLRPPCPTTHLLRLRPGPVVAIVWFVAAPLAGRAGDQLFAPRHVARVKSVTSAAVSPDGAYVAYSLAVPRNPLAEENGSAWSELHVVDRQGRGRPFVSGKVNVYGIQWTPDGKAIAFRARRGDDPHTALYRIPIDGGEARPLVRHDADIRSASFSPDGKRIALLAIESLPQQEQEFRAKGFHQQIYEENFRPTKVWITTGDGSAKPRALNLSGSVSQVRWSPDGRHLAVILGQAPVRLVFYPGEGHGNRRAAARLDYNLRMLRWMEHYLQGPGGDPPDDAIDYAREMAGD